MLRADLGGYRMPRQRNPYPVRQGPDHVVGASAGAIVTEDPNPLLLPEALVKVELVPSPPEESCRIQRLESAVQKLDDRFTSLLGGTSAAPVQRVTGSERLQVPVRILSAEATQIRLCDLRVVAKHPDSMDPSGGFHEFGDPIALDEGFDGDDFERESVYATKDGGIVLPFGLPWVRYQPDDDRAPRE